ncbi:DEAD/DEAH box helicase [Steroidobacter sp.]|uniref:DEAD/DEAH box helicase n=1 Tax=Steroidobacter sp. TaxID=1978227 RepID=UPI001A3BB023|nr:DEAD/DEAH box helicase [Steroidobacter sp.]MBL8271184.1 DEAD/DEAH box helicase [Steroidobacter sp.]
MPFTALGLIPELTRALADRGYDAPTPVQARVIPEILAGRDVLAGSQTGTGKTAGFTLPLLQRLQSGTPSRSPRVLVLVPTRELAAQVNESVASYGKYLRHRSLTIFGGVSINPQIEALRRGADILVATPGRLLDHAQQRTVDLSRVEIFVLDEADRMLDMGFIADIRRVIKLLPRQRQNLMFSATYSDDIRKLAQGLLHDPVEIEVARRNAAVDTVEQRSYFVGKDQKRALLSHLIQDGDWQQVLVFTRTKHGANRLCKQLEQDGIEAAAIHGNKSQNARTAALSDFKNFRIRALVATEVASRGLDIKELPYVVNYELPNVPEDYVHRIGRTGRAGATGIAVSLVSSDESGLLKDIEKLLRKSIPRGEVPVFKAAPPPARDDRREDSRDRSSQPRQSRSELRPDRGNDRGQGRSQSGDGRSQSQPGWPSQQNQAGASGQGRSRPRKRRGGGGGGQPGQHSSSQGQGQGHGHGQQGQQPRQAQGQRSSRPQGQGYGQGQGQGQGRPQGQRGPSRGNRGPSSSDRNRTV